MNRSYSPPNQAALFRTAQRMQVPLGRVGGPVFVSAPASCGTSMALARADAILAGEASRARTIVEPETEPIDPGVDDFPFSETEPEDPSHTSSLEAKQDDEEEDEDMPRDEETGRSKQNGDGDENEDPEERDITVIAVEAEEEHDHEPEDYGSSP